MKYKIGMVMWCLAGGALATVWVVASKHIGYPDKTWWIGAPITVLAYVITVPRPNKKG